MTRLVALVGNPNTGKTTLFNALTGASIRVGNYPGITVERTEGRLRGAPDVAVLDVPGALQPHRAQPRGAHRGGRPAGA